MIGIKVSKTMEPWIETFSGKKFYFLDPKPEMVDIEDIAHALSNSCRYTGHCSDFYSVAEHSVAVSEIAGDSLQGLLHDASEAYIADISSPVKPHLKNYKTIEKGIMVAIAEKFNFSWPPSEEVEAADLVQLSTEAWHLLPSKGKQWPWEDWVSVRPKISWGITPRCLSPKRAYKLFLAKYEALQGL